MSLPPLLRSGRLVRNQLLRVHCDLYPRAMHSLAGPSRFPAMNVGPKWSCITMSHIRMNEMAIRSTLQHTAPMRFSVQARSASTVSFASDPSARNSSKPFAKTLSNAGESSRDSTASDTQSAVAYHLFFCAGLVYLIIVVGGLTRLTESGLSITEWNPGFKGMRLPLKDEEWDAEWEKYKKTPEWAVLNQHMTVDDFKKIYMWEWSHRIIGRVIGVAFAVPAVYFLSRGYMARGNRWKLVAIGLGIGFQGALGWFMVQSGLKAPEQTPPAIAPQHPNSTASTSMRDMPLDGAVTNILDGPSTSSEWHPRVSHFRLAAHLGTAFLVYLGMLHTGLAIVRDNRLLKGSGNAGGWSMSVPSNAAKLVTALTSDNRVARLRNVSRAMFVLTFATAMTGALVAGLDAGLVYSEFPYMGEGFIPPTDELLDERYAPNRKDRRQLIIGNATQNPVTVQLIHRCMAVTTLASAVGLAFYTRRVSSSMLRTAGRTQSGGITLPPSVPRLATLVAAAAVGQATLGISTLIYLVPIELASAHQAGSVALLSAVVALLASLRRPNSRVLRLLTQKHAISSSTAKEVHRQATVERALSRVVKASS